MELTGKKVLHRKFGEGTITRQTASSITVSFTCGNKLFQFPSCFHGYLKLLDTDLAIEVTQQVAQHEQAPSGDTLSGIAGGGVIKGLLSSASVGGFSKSYDIDKTVVSDDEAKFWNQTSYGASLMALYKTKSEPSILVITSYNVPGAN